MARALRGSVGRGLYLGAAWLLLASGPAIAQQGGALGAESYLAPPKEIAEVITAPRHENVSLNNLSPDRRYFLTRIGTGLPSLADLARPHYNLAGLFIDHGANRARSLTTGTTIGFELLAWESGRKSRIMAPRGARVSTPRWSPDGRSLAYFVHQDDATYLYLADVESGKSRRLTDRAVLATISTDISWSGDGSSVAVVLVPSGRGAAPERPAVPAHPQVLMTEEGENRLRTYASLLADRHDQELLEYYLTGQLARIEVRNGRVHEVGKPAMIEGVEPDLMGEYFQVKTVRKPFSYIVPLRMFGRANEVWDRGGKVLAELTSRPLNLGIRKDDSDSDDEEEEERRRIVWRPDGQGLSYLQKEPEPKGKKGSEKPKQKDRIMQWLPPFDSGSERVVYETENRITLYQFSTDSTLIFTTEVSAPWTYIYAVRADDTSEKKRITRRRTANFYGKPGTLLTLSGGHGSSGENRSYSSSQDLVRLSGDGKAVYLVGTLFNRKQWENAPRPFIDRVEIESGEKTRVFESSADRFEEVMAVLDDDAERMVIDRESATEVPNSYLIERISGNERRLTQNVDHTPAITAAQREWIEVTRADGVKFWAKVTLPADYVPGTRLPALFWFYPREYVSQAAYNRTKRRHNRNEFPKVGPRTMETMVLAGYAVVQPDAPIIGPRGQMNDSYIHDLRNNLAATIDEMDRRGLIDRTRLGLGGHSYGAFSTVNAMVHTPFFRAGIAGSGNFNRTLTPFAFQRERRPIWEARETYLEMSPILRAERLTGALLLYHGMIDQNVGTFPINSPRLFHALNSLGKKAALYMYPYEDHGPAARETLLDLWARWVGWLDEHLKSDTELVSAR